MSEPKQTFPIRKVLQEMADCSQQAGMFPDAINAVCDSWSELFAMVKDYADNADCGSNREHEDDAVGYIPVKDCWHCKAVALVAKAEGRAQ